MTKRRVQGPEDATSQVYQVTLTGPVSLYATMYPIVVNASQLLRQKNRTLKRAIRRKLRRSLSPSFLVLSVLLVCYLGFAILDNYSTWKLRHNLHLTPYDPNRPTNYSPEKAVRPNFEDYKPVMANFLLKKFEGKRNGFFVECGAVDGFFLSNTIALEEKLDWTGLLIEPDPIAFQGLKERNRRAWIADVCLSTEPYPMKVNMSATEDSSGAGLSRIDNEVMGGFLVDYNFFKRFEVECYPLSTLLEAIGRKKVDYFSLDVEGVELDVLKTIPWDKFKIELISVEVREKKNSREAIRSYLESVGYRWIEHVTDNGMYTHDDVYELKGQ